MAPYLKENSWKMKDLSLKTVGELVASIDVTNQAQIDELKDAHPGAGIGPCVQERLLSMIESGEIKSPSIIPTEYRNQLSHLFG